ncbi:MAG TPA: ATP-dependent Clp protease ATP-binding subunit [Aggregatilinea sp.]|jgi:ATP-dependent Clp protease ATP-binding subunit ClpC|uniref:ATP-dependent Clp protease ATP-binding subunit n=1 Tax=Aggregatilinea sp. TaxID=2806333 RepID=UPI002C1E0395|nr:ATP-dependent Clp protease ATP-binding subunit [Aggregatilinea sp.]HML21579.1 ATP-dependent Clp protease ATP-binding subunit [Aggregatilinea sp.]
MPSSPLDISEQEIRKRCGPLLEGAIEEATRLRHNYIGVEHLFNALTRIPGSTVARLLLEMGLEPREIRNLIRREVGAGDDVVSETPPLTPRAHRVLAMAVYLADDSGDRFVTEEQLLLALLQEGESLPARELHKLNVDLTDWIERLLDKIEDNDGEFDEFLFEELDSALEQAADDPAISGHRMPTPLLDKYGRDLTAQARAGKIGPAIGREREIRMVARTLTRSKKNNPLLLGDSGVGKTAVIEGLAFNISDGTAPRFLHGKRIVQLEIGTLVAGTSLRGQFEERIVGIVDEVKNAPEVILFIDEIHTIVGAGDTIDSNLDAANILKPALARGEITCIGATTFEEYRKAIAKDPALDRRFRTIDIGEQNASEALEVIEHVYQRYEQHHGVTITPEARSAAVRLSDRYMRDRRLPDKALDLLDEACARLVIQSNSPDQTMLDIKPEITAQTITEVLSEWTGIPVSELTANERQRFATMNDALRLRVVGQDHAIEVISDAVKTNRAGLGDPHRPVGVFLFLGPSGVGKTELAKALAEFLFNDENAMIRLDMSEFHGEHTVARLIGAPPGYKGMEQGGQLTEALRRKPYSVVLLDEVEKAAPEVFDIFLQVFDEGRLTDSQGATMDARHAVWIMTSNIGTGDVGKGLGFMASPEDLPDYDFHLKKHFRPEFLNRLDEVVVFHPLTEAALNQILDLQMLEVVERLQAQNLTLILDDSARTLLLHEGYDPANGARPLRRAIERLLTRPLSTAILSETFVPGDTIRAVSISDRLVLEREEATAHYSTPESHPVREDVDGSEPARAE